jgi:pimeloyl-ACP methyl ester carboxylesterase
MAPWALAMVVLAAGYALLRWAGRMGRHKARRVARIPGLTLFSLGVVLLIGTAYSAITVARVKAAHPMPGRMVDVSGTGIHVWCNGEKSDRTILLLPGGYGQALWFAHLKRGIEGRYRTCLVDRPGLGWSDMRPLPHQTEILIRETRQALMAAGESFPLIIVGHSFGGFYATNHAALFPDDVLGVMLLDPTAPHHNSAMAIDGCHPPPYRNMLASMFGLAHIDALNPMHGDGMKTIADAVGASDWKTLVTLEMRPSALAGGHSAMMAPCRNPVGAIPAARGILGDLPITLVVQNPNEPEDAHGRPGWLQHLSDFEYANHTAYFDMADSDYQRMSSNVRFLLAPRGSGHNFPHTHREFTIRQIVSFVNAIDAGRFEGEDYWRGFEPPASLLRGD